MVNNELDGFYHRIEVDVVSIGCSYEYREQKVLNAIEGHRGTGSLNFLHYPKNKYSIEKPSLILETNNPPSKLEHLEMARRILQILWTIENKHSGWSFQKLVQQEEWLQQEVDHLKESCDGNP